MFVLISLILTFACGSKSDKNIETKTSATVRESTESTKHLSKSGDIEITFNPTQLTKETGLQISNAKLILGLVDGGEISIDAVASQSLNATIIAKAFDAKNQELGRAIVEVKMVKDFSVNLFFKFPSKIDKQINEYSFEVIQTP